MAARKTQSTQSATKSPAKAPTKAPARRQAERLDDRITRAFLKSVGVECGLYNPHAGEFAPDVETHHLYQANLEIVRGLLKENRYSAKELEDLVYQCFKMGQRAALLSEILPKHNPRQAADPEENLLEDGVVYQHMQLYVRTAPSFVVSGEQMVCSSPGRSVPKECYRLGELLEYYYRRLPVPQVASRKARDLGGMRFLLDAWRVDEILHAIDLAAERELPLGVLKLEDFLPAARQTVKDRAARRLG